MINSEPNDQSWWNAALLSITLNTLPVKCCSLFSSQLDCLFLSSSLLTAMLCSNYKTFICLLVWDNPLMKKYEQVKHFKLICMDSKHSGQGQKIKVLGLCLSCFRHLHIKFLRQVLFSFFLLMYICFPSGDYHCDPLHLLTLLSLTGSLCYL